MTNILKSRLTRKTLVSTLTLEIIIVTVIGWMVMEPVAVGTSIATLPEGYDCDRLAMLTISEFKPVSEEYDSTLNNPEIKIKSQERLLNMIRGRMDVEKATFATYQSPEQSSSSSSMIESDSIYHQDNDENGVVTYMIQYIPDTDFFSTFGITDADGNPFKEPVPTSENCHIITKTLARAIYPNGNIIGKDLYPKEEDDEDYYPTPIIGVTGDISYRKRNGRIAAAFIPQQRERYSDVISGITVRIPENVSPRAFINKITSELDNYRSGNLYLTKPELYSDMQAKLYASKHRELSRQWIIAVFFLVNVFLGVAGTFYVQCKTRIPDAGVMRAFGATRRRIKRNIMGEAWLTVCAGWLAGSVIYLIYLKTQGFQMESDASHVIQAIRPMWYDTAFGRYSIIGGIILLLLLAMASLGAWLPARKVGNVNIVDSLRSEE